MIDKIRNPWRKRNGVMVFDIETNCGKDWSEQGKKNRIFKCGVAFSYDEKKYYEFAKPKQFTKLLKKAKTLVSYNGEGFDFLVLKKYGLKIKKYKNRWKPNKIESLDIMHTIDENRPEKNRDKKYPSLEEMISQHYGEKKTKYDQDDIKQLLNHCHEDVKYTKKLYEEKIWQVPILKRGAKKQRWENYYDDDMSGVVWDGTSWTYIRDFGMPIKKNINPEAKKLCPKCKAKKLSLYEVIRGRKSEIVCPKCGTVVTFSPANEIISIQSKKEHESNICKNCGKRIEEISYQHYGYGAGYGYLRSGRSVCPACSNGCYEWREDDTPGFKEHLKGSCCKCKMNIDQLQA